MIYFELHLDGRVNVFDMTDRLFLLRASLETKAAALPVPTSVEQAHEYARSDCYQFEMFDCIEQAERWQADYRGFRAAEVQAAFARFQERRAAHSLYIAA